MLVIARFSLGVGLQTWTPVGSAFFMPVPSQNLRYVTLNGLALPQDDGRAALSDGPA
jgi:hypothetical protein